jgi:hypothetical protein
VEAASHLDGSCLTSCQSTGAYVIRKVVPIGPLSYPLCFLVPLMSVIDKVFKYGPNPENQRQDPQIEHISIFFAAHAAQANIIYANWASMNQHPPAPQLGILSTGWGGISHLMVNVRGPFLSLFLLAGFFLQTPPLSTLRSLAQLHTTYLLYSHLLFPPKLVTSFLPTYPPPYLPTQHLHNINSNQWK